MAETKLTREEMVAQLELVTMWSPELFLKRTDEEIRKLWNERVLNR
jgi:hypothetical protein